MKGVSTGTSGLSAVRGRRRVLLPIAFRRRHATARIANIALLGAALLAAILLAGNWGKADDDSSSPSPGSNRDFLQNGQQQPMSRKKSAGSDLSPKAEESRVAALIAQRRMEADAQKLADVVVEGNTTIPTAAILQKIKSQPKRPATAAQIQADIRALYSTRWFITVETELRHRKDGEVLIFKVIERPIVHSVEYKGNLEMSTKKLAAEIGLKVGSPFDFSANHEAAKHLESFYHQKGFPEATVVLEKGGSPTDRDVVFRIHEGTHQKVLYRSFDGNNSFSGEVLVLCLKSEPPIGWVIGGDYDPANLAEDVAGLRKYYADLGYFDAKAEPHVSYTNNHKWVYLHYSIHEGQHYKIRHIDMTGNVRFTTAELQKDIKTHEGEFFNARLINKDVAKIKKKYGALGYFFSTVEIVPRFLVERGEIDLLVRIDEDPYGVGRYTIRQIRFHIDGDHSRTKWAVPLNYTGLTPGDLADPAKVDKSKKKLTGAQIFHNDPGNPGGNFKLVVHRVEDGKEKEDPVNRGQSDEDSEEDLTPPVFRPFDREVPPPASVPRQPPSRTPVSVDPDGDLKPDPPRIPVLEDAPNECWFERFDPVVRAQSPDDPFASNPMFNPSPQGDPFGATIHRTPNGQIDLDYYLAEERTGRLMFGVGVNSSAGLVGSIILQEQNFDINRPPQSWDDIMNGTAWRGGGQRLRIEAAPGTQVSRYTISWSDPYFLNTNNNLGLSGYYWQRYYRDWTEDRAGGRITVGRQFTQEVSGTVALRLEGVRIADARVPAPPILEEAEGDSFLSTVRAALVHDTRDSPFLPGEGHRAEASYEQAFGQFVYPRVEANAQQFFTLYQRPDGGGRQILTVGGQMGWTGNDTPIFERFYAGGFQSFRGFYFRGVSPMVEDTQIGGTFMAIGTVEYMVPLLANGMIQMVFFSDFGTVNEAVSLGDFRLSVGTGLRIAIPAMGPVPLAFDFGIPVIRQPNDITQVFSFYVGLNR